MTLTIQTEEDAQRQLKMTIDVAEERVQQATRRTVARLARDVQIPGFRKGKAPFQVVVRRIGEAALRAETVEEMFPALLEEAYKQAGVEPYAAPEIDSLQMQPLQITLTVPLRPVVDLGDYRSRRKETPPIEVSEEAIQSALEQIRERHQILEPVERPAERGDMVTIGGSGHLVESNRSLFQDESYEFMMDASDSAFGWPFIDNLVGLAAGDEKTFRFQFPADHEDEEWAGQEVEFQLTMLDVKSRTVPELNDELAQQEGDYETLAELREAVIHDLTEHAADESSEKLFEEAFEELTSQAQIAYPPAALKAELDGMIDNLKEWAKNTGWKWEDYLRLNTETEEKIRERWHDAAADRLRRRLVMQEFIALEKLELNQDEIEAAINDRYGHLPPELQTKLRQHLAEGDGLTSLITDVLLNKVKGRMEAIVTGRAADLDNLESADTIAEEE